MPLPVGIEAGCRRYSSALIAIDRRGIDWWRGFPRRQEHAVLSRGRTARQPFRVNVQFCKCKVVDPDEMMASSGFGLMAAASRTWLTLRTPKTTGKADADPGNRSRPAQSRSTPTSAKGARAAHAMTNRALCRWPQPGSAPGSCAYNAPAAPPLTAGRRRAAVGSASTPAPGLPLH